MNILQLYIDETKQEDMNFLITTTRTFSQKNGPKMEGSPKSWDSNSEGGTMIAGRSPKENWLSKNINLSQGGLL
ncbi:hypothetical protein ACFLRM_02985 [Acidobacteriota bacterium]